MPAINWNQVGNDTAAAVKSVVGGAWQTASAAAGPQIQAMIVVGQTIERDYKAGKLTQAEYDSLQIMQKNALEGILNTYEAIGAVVAEQAADAAWGVIAKALGTVAGVPFV